MQAFRLHQLKATSSKYYFFDFSWIPDNQQMDNPDFTQIVIVRFISFIFLFQSKE